MKKLLSLLVVALLGAGAVNACAQAKKEASLRDKPLTIIVMDTTQALLDDAEVKVGKTVFRTSFDGRVVLEPKQVEGVTSLAVSREGYVSQTVTLTNDEPLIVFLKAKPRKYDKDGGSSDVYYSLGSSRSGKHYAKPAATTEMVLTDAMMDRAAPDMPMPSFAGESAPAYANVSAGKLTAGEVNDFASWYMWPKIIDDSHKAFVGEWKLAPRNRYTVRVMTKSGAPIAARAVSLLDEHGNTLFQAVTDNTGTAELWSNLTTNDQRPTTNALQIRVDDHRIAAKPWAEGVNTFVLDEECETSDAVDVVFVFDATGSMGDELRYLQAEMKDVIRRSQGAVDGLTIRTGALVYRDYSDNYLTRISRLGNDIDLTQRFIDKQEASGGGDYEEAVPEALKAALSVAGWDDNARARILFLVLDAPCHKDSATLAMLHEQILDAAAMGVRIVPVVCSGLGKSGELLMREMALATNGTSFFLTDDSGIGNPHLKPTIDSLKVEHLNDMLVRTIIEYSTMPECSGEPEETEMQIEPYIPNPFNAQDIANDPTIPHGETMLYVIDVTGKVIGRMEGEMDAVTPEQLISRYSVSTGVYFIKAFYDGEWHTRKIFVYRF